MKLTAPLLALGLLGIGALAPVRADAAPPASRTVSRADSAAAASRPKTAPWKVMARSAVVPGWGQMYNHQPLKAALVVGTDSVAAMAAIVRTGLSG